MTSACTPAILGEIRDSTGRRNANVFPEPVGESSIMSFGRVAVSSICFCMPFSESIFKLRHALSIRADVSFMSKPRVEANLFVYVGTLPFGVVQRTRKIKRIDLLLQWRIGLKNNLKKMTIQ